MRSASVFTPGVGMWEPSRNTASMPSVKRTRLRSSGIAAMARRLSIMDAVPCGSGLRLRGGAERLGLVRMDQMVAALVRAVEHPPAPGTLTLVDVPRIRSAA